MRPARAAWLAALAALAAGCATVEPNRPAAPKQKEEAVAQPQESATEQAPVQKPKERGARKSGPRAIATRPINVKADCSFKDPSGYRGTMKLQVADAQVRQFEATVNVPDHGSCSFALRDFSQTAQMPNPVLRHRSNGCEVRLWEQGQRVTVAFLRCRANCSSHGAFERLWPILADAGNGSCG